MRGKTTVNTAADGTSITTISICAAVYADAARAVFLPDRSAQSFCAFRVWFGAVENNGERLSNRRHFVCVRFRFPVSDLLGLDDSNDGV